MRALASGHKAQAILLTGASRGLGSHIAVALAAQGHRLALVSRSTTSDERLHRRIKDADSEVIEWQADITDQQAMAGIVDEVLKRWGRIDVLINNAAQKLFDDFLSISAAQFEQVIRTNLIAPILLTRMVVPSMVKQGYGRIINVSSRAGLEFDGKVTAYGSSKAGLIGFSRSLAIALRGTGVNVNVLCPPTVMTPEYAKARPDLDTRRLVTVDQLIRVIMGLIRPDCRKSGRVIPFYSPASLVKACLTDTWRYFRWLCEIRYRVR